MSIFHRELGYGYLEGFWLRHQDMNLSIQKKTRNALDNREPEPNGYLTTTYVDTQNKSPHVHKQDQMA